MTLFSILVRLVSVSWTRSRCSTLSVWAVTCTSTSGAEACSHSLDTHTGECTPGLGAVRKMIMMVQWNLWDLYLCEDEWWWLNRMAIKIDAVMNDVCDDDGWSQAPAGSCGQGPVSTSRGPKRHRKQAAWAGKQQGFMTEWRSRCAAHIHNHNDNNMTNERCDRWQQEGYFLNLSEAVRQQLVLH